MSNTQEHVIWGPLEEFPIELTNGHVLTVQAHAYHVENGEYVFSILMRGSPAYEISVVRLPEEIVASNPT